MNKDCGKLENEYLKKTWVVINMPDFELTSHAKAMLLERKNSEDLLWRTINTPRDCVF